MATIRAVATNAAAVQRGIRARLYSSFASSPFNQAQTRNEKPSPAEPSTNLFVSGGSTHQVPIEIGSTQGKALAIGLSKRTTSEGLRDAFAKFGEVLHAKVVTDRVSGYSKGFGFVRYATIKEAEAGIKGMDGQFLDGWVIFAEYARARPPPSNNTFPQGYQ